MAKLATINREQKRRDLVAKYANKKFGKDFVKPGNMVTNGAYEGVTKDLFDGVAKVRLAGETSDRHVVVLDLLEHRLDPVQLRAVSRQVVQINATHRQRWPSRLDCLTGVNAGVVQHDHLRDLGTG